MSQPDSAGGTPPPATPDLTALLSSALQLFNAGRFQEAEEIYRQIVSHAPRHIRAWNGLARIYESCQRPMLASRAYAEQGWALLHRSLLDEAGLAFEKSLENDAGHAAARACLALVRGEQGRHDEAQALAEKALDQDPSCAQGWQALGLVAAARGQDEMAMEHARKALHYNPDLIAVREYLGSACSRLGRPEEALREYEMALAGNPANPKIHFARGLTLLKLGRYREGWLDYEWRFLAGHVAKPDISQPRWRGEELDGRSILIHTEQGMGDVIQFVRFLPWLKERGARVVFGCQTPLQRVLAQCAGIDEWMPIDEPAPITFELVCPLLSLPGILGINEPNIPADVPYIFADEERVEHWRSTIRELGGFKVGICWQGSPTFGGDAQRSIPLQDFARLQDIPDVHLISLQKHHGLDQIERLGDKIKLTRLDTSDELEDTFMDTAAVMQHLDLVICVDTAPAHLAGALGVPVWVLLPTGNDWRWQQHRSDSPWYPTMRLFRQPEPGDWAATFELVADALKQHMKGSEGRSGLPRT